MSYNGTQADQLFTLAVNIVTSRLPRNGSAQVSYSSKLSLYALYKQATEGDVNTPRPGLLDMLGRAKWDAWKERQGMSDKDAKLLYVESLAKILKAAQGDPLSQSLYQELQSLASQPLASETESGSETEDSDSDGESDASHSQPPPSNSLVDAVRREARQRHSIPADVEDERETIAPLPASTLLHESQHSLPSSMHASSYVGLSSAPPRTIRSAGARTPAEQLLSLSSSQLKQEWLAEQQWRHDSQQQQHAQHSLHSTSMTEAHLQAHNRYSAKPAPSPRPPSVRSVPVPLESTLQAIHTSLQALHERISLLEAENLRNRARRSPWSSLLSRSLYILSLIWRSPDAEGSGYIYHQQQQHRQRRLSATSILLGLWDQVRDAILVALLVAFLLRRRHWLLDWSWIKPWLPKYRIKLVQSS